jgi:hypothetical protein
MDITEADIIRMKESLAGIQDPRREWGNWSIENQLHWSLDVLFREDASQVRKGRAPENMNILRKIALGRLRATDVPGRRLSTKRKIFKASVNPDFLYSVLFGK